MVIFFECVVAEWGICHRLIRISEKFLSELPHLNRTKIQPTYDITILGTVQFILFLNVKHTKAVLFVLQDNLTTHPGCQKGTNLTAKYMGKLTNGDHLHKLE